MSTETNVQIEIGFAGGEVLNLKVTADSASALRSKLAAGEPGVCELTAEGSSVTVVLSRVAYVRKSDREARVGFFA